MYTAFLMDWNKYDLNKYINPWHAHVYHFEVRRGEVRFGEMGSAATYAETARHFERAVLQVRELEKDARAPRYCSSCGEKQRQARFIRVSICVITGEETTLYKHCEVLSFSRVIERFESALELLRRLAETEKMKPCRECGRRKCVSACERV